MEDRAGIGVAGEETGDLGRVVHGGRKAHAAEAGAERLEAGERQHELVAAFGFGEGVDFVDDHAFEPREGAGGVLVGEEEGEAFRCRQQDMRRIGALAALGGGGGVAGAVLDPDGQASSR